MAPCGGLNARCSAKPPVVVNSGTAQQHNQGSRRRTWGGSAPRQAAWTPRPLSRAYPRTASQQFSGISTRQPQFTTKLQPFSATRRTCRLQREHRTMWLEGGSLEKDQDVGVAGSPFRPITTKLLTVLVTATTPAQLAAYFRPASPLPLLPQPPRCSLCNCVRGPTQRPQQP